MSTLENGIILKSRYKILDQLGAGGMGEVYLADDQALENKVALKANHNLNANATAQFIREARLLASLKQPNLPRVIDYFTENDSQFLVMDFIPGENFRTLVENKTTFTIPQILSWADQLGTAITYLHTQNPPIYHRDIKPANIKLTPAGDVVLVDFGIAKTGDPSAETQSGAWAFTPGFAPPEQVSGMRTGPQSDQFSLASTLYYLIASKAPADSARRLMGEEELLSLKAFMPEVPNHVSDAIDKALSIKPDARFSTVADFVAALRSPAPIPDPASAQKTVMGTRPQPPAIHGILPSTPSIPPPAIPQPKDVLEKKRKSSFWFILVSLILLGVLIGGFFALRSLGIIGGANPAQPTLAAPTVMVVGEIPTQTPESQPSPQPTSAPTEEPAPTITAAPVITGIGHGGKVAFVSNRQADGNLQVWMMDVGTDQSGAFVTSNIEQVTFSPGDKANPSFSPDGKTLLFSGVSTGFSNNGTPFAMDIWTLDLTSPDAQPVDISLRAADDLYAAWSPDGKWIAFTSYYREDKMPQLFIMSPTGYPQTRLSLGVAESYASWTPDANFLLYVLTTGQLNVLHMRDRYSTYYDFSKFDRSTDEGRLGLVAQPNVSLDGSMIAYTGFTGAKKNILTAVFADRGRTTTKLTETNKDYAPFWSPDGDWILFTSERDDNKEIYIMDAQGQQVTNLTDHPGVDSDPAWQPVMIQ